jgi:hypothetical protein
MGHRTYLKSAIGTAALILVQISTSNASPVTYTFDGTGTVTLGGVALGNTFSLVFTGDTSIIDGSDNPYFKNTNLTGLFTDGGVSETITATVESNSSFGNIDFYDSTYTNGLGLQDNATAKGLAGYDLSTSIGPVLGPPEDLTPTFGGGVFTTADGDLQFTASDTLSFTADVSSTPLPGALPLFGTGLGMLGLFEWRRWKKSAPKNAA